MNYFGTKIQGIHSELSIVSLNVINEAESPFPANPQTVNENDSILVSVAGQAFPAYGQGVLCNTGYSLRS